MIKIVEKLEELCNSRHRLSDSKSKLYFNIVQLEITLVVLLVIVFKFLI